MHLHFYILELIRDLWNLAVSKHIVSSLNALEDSHNLVFELVHLGVLEDLEDLEDQSCREFLGHREYQGHLHTFCRMMYPEESGTEHWLVRFS